eukprot:GDKH01008808.1.p2 GENE.GDKH01008808.1~~GDKH01008808.1.p2  ORF type:complete len:86 (-),score=8.16 GDKH01008808.1:33-290(-)
MQLSTAAPQPWALQWQCLVARSPLPPRSELHVTYTSWQLRSEIIWSCRCMQPVPCHSFGHTFSSWLVRPPSCPVAVHPCLRCGGD